MVIAIVIVASACWLGVQVGAWAVVLALSRPPRAIWFGTMIGALAIVAPLVVVGVTAVRDGVGQDVRAMEYFAMPAAVEYAIGLSYLGLRFARRIVDGRS